MERRAVARRLIAGVLWTFGKTAISARVRDNSCRVRHQWVNRVHRLPRHISGLLAATCGHDPRAERLYQIDSKPIPVCHPMRHVRVRALRDEGASFGKDQ